MKLIKEHLYEQDINKGIYGNPTKFEEEHEKKLEPFKAANYTGPKKSYLYTGETPNTPQYNQHDDNASNNASNDNAYINNSQSYNSRNTEDTSNDSRNNYRQQYSDKDEEYNTSPETEGDEWNVPMDSEIKQDKSKPSIAKKISNFFNKHEKRNETRAKNTDETPSQIENTQNKPVDKVDNSPEEPQHTMAKKISNFSDEKQSHTEDNEKNTDETPETTQHTENEQRNTDNVEQTDTHKDDNSHNAKYMQQWMPKNDESNERISSDNESQEHTTNDADKSIESQEHVTNDTDKSIESQEHVTNDADKSIESQEHVTNDTDKSSDTNKTTLVDNDVYKTWANKKAKQPVIANSQRAGELLKNMQADDIFKGDNIEKTCKDYAELLSIEKKLVNSKNKKISQNATNKVYSRNAQKQLTDKYKEIISTLKNNIQDETDKSQLSNYLDLVNKLTTKNVSKMLNAPKLTHASNNLRQTLIQKMDKDNVLESLGISLLYNDMDNISEHIKYDVSVLKKYYNIFEINNIYKDINHLSGTDVRYIANRLIEEAIDIRSDRNVGIIARKFGVSVGMVNDELKFGVEVEQKYTDNKNLAITIALDNLKDNISYYSDIRKLRNKVKDVKK